MGNYDRRRIIPRLFILYQSVNGNKHAVALKQTDGQHLTARSGLSRLAVAVNGDAALSLELDVGGARIAEILHIYDGVCTAAAFLLFKASHQQRIVRLDGVKRRRTGVGICHFEVGSGFGIVVDRECTQILVGNVKMTVWAEWGVLSAPIKLTPA